MRERYLTELGIFGLFLLFHTTRQGLQTFDRILKEGDGSN